MSNYDNPPTHNEDGNVSAAFDQPAPIDDLKKEEENATVVADCGTQDENLVDASSEAEKSDVNSKGKAAFAVTHKKVVAMLGQMSILEVQDTLGLSSTQLQRHLFQAFYKGKVTDAHLFKQYTTVRARALPEDIYKILRVDGDTLVKIEGDADGVILTALRKGDKANVA